MGFFLALPSWPGEEEDPAARPATTGSTPGSSVMSVSVEFPMPGVPAPEKGQQAPMAGSDSTSNSPSSIYESFRTTPRCARFQSEIDKFHPSIGKDFRGINLMRSDRFDEENRRVFILNKAKSQKRIMVISGSATREAEAKKRRGPREEWRVVPEEIDGEAAQGASRSVDWEWEGAVAPARGGGGREPSRLSRWETAQVGGADEERGK